MTDSHDPDRKQVRAFYGDVADFYTEMMDGEIQGQLYADMLGRLAARLQGLEGPILDTSCGPGHMLALYHQAFDADRPLWGNDLTAAMVERARERLGKHAEIVLGDMRSLDAIADGEGAALISFFALQHLEHAEVPATLAEWRRALRPGGQMLLATWEGEGLVDYGEHGDIVAHRIPKATLEHWVAQAGFTIDRLWTEPMEEFESDGVYLEATASMG